jgi:hypothetical protein
MSKLESMRKAVRVAVVAAALALQPAGVLAHHSSQAEFGPFGSDTIFVEATIVAIHWGNPHIGIDVRTTGGELPAGQNWRLVSHPIQIMNAYGFVREEFAVGDSVKLLGWKNLRGTPQIWPRAIQVNDGPMKSNLRFTDMIDIAKGVFESMNIQPAANLNGSPPARAGADTVAKLQEMGLIDENGLMIWPPR